MAISRNRLGRTIVNSIHGKTRTSTRYHGEYDTSVMELTVAEHRAVFGAIADGDPERAAAAMRAHVLGSWTRRRPAPGS